MDILQTFATLALLPALAAIVYILAAKPTTGSAVLAAMLSAGFAAFTAVQIYTDGIVMFWTNHTQNLTGIQVWWDLLICVVIALFFIAPRARAAGMQVPLWTLLVATTASIGLLAMIARLFWLEAGMEAQREATPPEPTAPKPAKA